MTIPAVEILLLIGLIVFISHALEAVTGFGCSVLAFPFVIALLGDLEQSKIILSILAWILALYFVITKFRAIDWKQFGIIVLLAGIGMPAGILLFNTLDATLLKRVLGIFIVISAAIQLYQFFVPSSGIFALPKSVYCLFLTAGGMVHGAFAVGGPLIVLYSAKKIRDKGQFRATMCLLWTSLNMILILNYFHERKITPAIGLQLLALLPFLISGIIVGEFVHHKISELLFKKIVFAVLLLVGVSLIV
ncbi:MAG: TSUP family transporter [Dysgonamonadaceae bacterium]|jgi:uncharacterized membrane protein YfcA|nr:TSUP family transporter [Dysgonamonadaceae bacterium]